VNCVFCVGVGGGGGVFLAVIGSFVINTVFKIGPKYANKFNFWVRFHWK